MKKIGILVLTLVLVPFLLFASGKAEAEDGGGLIGIEIAVKMADADNEVIVVEMLDEVARGMEMIERTLSLKHLRAKDVRILTKFRVASVDGKSVRIEGPHGETETLSDVDHVVLAVGMRSNRALADELVSTEGTNIHIVGDAARVGKAQSAIRSAYLTAARL